MCDENDKWQKSSSIFKINIGQFVFEPIPYIHVLLETAIFFFLDTILWVHSGINHILILSRFGWQCNFCVISIGDGGWERCGVVIRKIE